jgi:hypothetical protein
MLFGNNKKFEDELKAKEEKINSLQNELTTANDRISQLEKEVSHIDNSNQMNELIKSLKASCLPRARPPAIHPSRTQMPEFGSRIPMTQRGLFPQSQMSQEADTTSWNVAPTTPFKTGQQARSTMPIEHCLLICQILERSSCSSIRMMKSLIRRTPRTSDAMVGLLGAQ